MLAVKNGVVQSQAKECPQPPVTRKHGERFLLEHLKEAWPYQLLDLGLVIRIFDFLLLKLME
jgi:hypothetical protein